MKTTLLLLAIVLGLSVQAQKIKLVSGDLSFLKGQKSIMVDFEYSDDLMVGKMTEAEYIKKKQADAEAHEAGSGEKWLEMWKGDRVKHYQPKFIELMNAYLVKPGVTVSETATDAKYKLVVTTTFIEPGFNVGVMSRPAYINLTLTFVEIASGKEMAKLTLEKSPGQGVGDYDTGYRVGEAYAKAGKELAKFLVKKKAFK
jgi:hypothetical protein